MSVHFGFCVPVFANPGMSFFRTPCWERLEWPAVRDAVLECEALGYDSLFVADHMFLGRDGAIFEGWTLLAALAGMTTRLRLAPIHLCDSFRNPALTAKMIATLDVVSGGRVILFYDYGWRRAEFDAYGFAFEASDDERTAKMVEGLEVVKGLLTLHAVVHGFPEPGLRIASRDQHLCLERAAERPDVASLAAARLLKHGELPPQPLGGDRHRVEHVRVAGDRAHHRRVVGLTHPDRR